MRSPIAFRPSTIALAVLSGIISTSSFGGSFQLSETSATGVATSQSNKAETSDAGVMAFNPAGLAWQSGRQLSGSLTALDFSAKLSNKGTSSAVGTPASGGNGGDAGGLNAIPAAFFAMDLAPNLRFGLGITAPFALKTEYDEGWFGRYFALTSDLKTVDINPAISYKVNDTFAIGGGVSLQYAEATLSRAIDFGAACYSAFIPRLGQAAGVQTCNSGGFIPQTKDGKVTLKADDWSAGVNLGLMFRPNAGTNIGLSYRSAITHDLSGDAKFNKPDFPGPFAAIGASPSVTDGGGKAKLKLPDTISLSGFTQVNDRLALMGDITHIRWSRFDEVRVRFANGAADSVEEQKYKDVTRVAIGASYQLDNQWRLRAGAAFDPTPVRDELRAARVPDNDRTWVSFGVDYKVAADSTVSFGYAHLIFKDAKTDLTVAGQGRLVSDVKGGADIFTLQYATKF